MNTATTSPLTEPSTPESVSSHPAEELHTISILVQNKPGVLGRISLVFSRRGFNIESLVVSATRNPESSRFTITVNGDKENLEQVIRHIRKLVNVIKAYDHHNNKKVIERELALVKVVLDDTSKNLFTIIDHFKAITLDLTQDSMVIQVTGSTEKIDAFLKVIEPYSIMETIRTGKVLIRRGPEET